MTDFGSCDWRILLYAGTGGGSVQGLDVSPRQDLVFPLLYLLSQLSSRLASVSITCFFYSHWRADPTPDHTLSQIQVPAERVRFCFPKVLAKALFFFQWALTESCDHIWICHPRQLIQYTYWFYSEHWEELRRGLEVHDSRMGKVQYTKNYDQDWAKMMSEAVSTEITKVLPLIHRGYVLRPPLGAWNLR